MGGGEGGMNSGTSEWLAVPVSLVTPVV